MPLTMTLNPGNHKFTLSDDTLKTMAATLWHTRVKERGNMLCVPPRTPVKLMDGHEYVGEIGAGKEHIGGPGSITERNCPGKVRVGHYHTHPGDSPADLSWWDAYSILRNSWRGGLAYLGCRGSKVPAPEGQIQCQTVRKIPTAAEVLALQTRHKKKKFTSAIADPEIYGLITDAYSFPARRVPEIIKPPTPVPAPRIKVEELVFTTSAFKKYTNLDTGESWTERI